MLRDFATLPMAEKWLSGQHRLLQLCRALKVANFNCGTAEFVTRFADLDDWQRHCRSFQLVHTDVKRHGLPLRNPPKVKGNAVEGRHRLLYLLALGLPAMVEQL